MAGRYTWRATTSERLDWTASELPVLNQSCAQLWPDEPQWEEVVAGIGLDSARLPKLPAMYDRWRATIEAAFRKQRIRALIERVIQDSGGQSDLALARLLELGIPVVPADEEPPEPHPPRPVDAPSRRWLIVASGTALFAVGLCVAWTAFGPREATDDTVTPGAHAAVVECAATPEAIRIKLWNPFVEPVNVRLQAWEFVRAGSPVADERPDFAIREPAVAVAAPRAWTTFIVRDGAGLGALPEPYSRWELTLAYTHPTTGASAELTFPCNTA